jgi:hypothetical protein
MSMMYIQLSGFDANRGSFVPVVEVRRRCGDDVVAVVCVTASVSEEPAAMKCDRLSLFVLTVEAIQQFPHGGAQRSEVSVLAA